MKELKKICIGFKGSFSSSLLLMTEWQIETINRRNILHWLLTLIDGRLCFPQILFNHFPFTWNFKWRSRRKWDIGFNLYFETFKKKIEISSARTCYLMQSSEVIMRSFSTAVNVSFSSTTEASSTNIWLYSLHIHTYINRLYLNAKFECSYKSWCFRVKYNKIQWK